MSSFLATGCEYTSGLIATQSWCEVEAWKWPGENGCRDCGINVERERSDALQVGAVDKKSLYLAAAQIFMQICVDQTVLEIDCIAIYGIAGANAVICLIVGRVGHERTLIASPQSGQIVGGVQVGLVGDVRMVQGKQLQR